MGLFGNSNKPLQASADQVSPGTLERPRALYGNQHVAGFGQFAGCRPEAIPGLKVRPPSNDYGPAYSRLPPSRQPHRQASPGNYGPPRHTQPENTRYRDEQSYRNEEARWRDAERPNREQTARDVPVFGAPQPPAFGSFAGRPGDRPLFNNNDGDGDGEDLWNLTATVAPGPMDLNKRADSGGSAGFERPPPSMPRRGGGGPLRGSYRPGAPQGICRRLDGYRPGLDAPVRTGNGQGPIKMDARTALQFFGNIVRDFVQAPVIPSPATNARTECLPAPPGGAQRQRRHSSFDLRIIAEPDPREYERVCVRIEMLEEQEMLYNAMLSEARRYLEQAGTAATNVHKILMNLRLACNSIDLLPPHLRTHLEQNVATGRLGPGLLRLLQDTSREGAADSVCPVCLDGLPEVRTSCGHVFHRECLEDWFATRTRTCPMCRVPIDQSGLQVCDRLQDAVMHAEELSKSTMIHLEAGSISHVSSNKLTKVTECVCVEIQNYRDLNDPDEEPPKFILVSSFRPMLMDMSRILQSFSIRYNWCFPSMAKSMIREELMSFNQTDQPAVLLLHARAVSTKMDFSAATFMYFMDPWKEGKLQSISESCLCKKRRGRKCLIVNFVSMGSIEEELVMNPPTNMPTDPAQIASRMINPLM